MGTIAEKLPRSSVSQETIDRAVIDYIGHNHAVPLNALQRVWILRRRYFHHPIATVDIISLIAAVAHWPADDTSIPRRIRQALWALGEIILIDCRLGIVPESCLPDTGTRIAHIPKRLIRPEARSK